MSENGRTRVVVGAHDTIPAVVGRLRKAAGAATITIPASSSLFLTANEFRALKATADQEKIALTVETDDRLRKQLATMFKLPVVDLLPGALFEVESEPEEQIEPGEPSLPPTLPELPKIELPPAQEVAPRWNPSDVETEEESAEAIEPRRRWAMPVSPRNLALSLVTVLAIALASLAAAYLLQTATIAITTKRQPVSAEVTFAAVGPGAEAPAGALFTVSAAPISVDVTYRETLTASGEVREPDQAANGTVALRNPSDAPVEIAAGTTFTAYDGVEYELVSAVVVPPADEAGAGRAEAQIRATIGGEKGNREIGMLTGRMDNGIYYSNRNTPVSGGTDKITRIVAQEDIDRLVANASEQLPRRIIGAPLQDGRVVLPGSIQAGELSYTTDHQAGDEADSVTIEAKTSLRALAFDATEAARQANAQLLSDLQANTPAGLALVPETMTLSKPELVNDQGTAALFSLSATASARALIDGATSEAIKEAVAGLDLDEAEAVLRGYAFVEAVEISSSPGFLPTRIPDDAGKIEIESR